MAKTKVIYSSKNPNYDWVKYIAIQTESNPPYVWATYGGRRENVPNLPEDLVVLPIKAARNIFDFQEGKLE